MSKNTEKAKLDSRARFHTNYKLGINASKNIELAQDAQLLAESIISYFESKDPNFEFTDFYDPNLLKELRTLVKEPEEFKKFLDTISFSMEDFLQISTYVVPAMYTSHLIKFIRETYLHKDPKLKK